MGRRLGEGVMIYFCLFEIDLLTRLFYQNHRGNSHGKTCDKSNE